MINPRSFDISEEADADLVEIWDYYFQASGSVDVADRQIEAIQKRFDSLKQFPMMGRSREELAPEMRGLSVGSYIILYRVKDTSVEIIRVLHGSRDLKALFNN